MSLFGFGFAQAAMNRHSHSTLVVRSFLSAERRGTGDRMLMSQRRVGPVVAQKKDQRVLGNTEFVKVVHHVA